MHSQLGTDGHPFGVVHLWAASPFERDAFAEPAKDRTRHIVLGAIAGQNIDRFLFGQRQMDARSMVVRLLEGVGRHFRVRHAANVNAMQCVGHCVVGVSCCGRNASQTFATTVDRIFGATNDERAFFLGSCSVDRRRLLH